MIRGFMARRTGRVSPTVPLARRAHTISSRLVSSRLVSSTSAGKPTSLLVGQLTARSVNRVRLYISCEESDFGIQSGTRNKPIPSTLTDCTVNRLCVFSATDIANGPSYSPGEGATNWPLSNSIGSGSATTARSSRFRASSTSAGEAYTRPRRIVSRTRSTRRS